MDNDLVPGEYHRNGDVVRVSQSHKTGRLYGERLNRFTGQFEYKPGLLKTIRPRDLAEAH